MSQPNFKDETGKKYGKLTVIKRADNTYLGTAKWLCQCECGNTKVCKGSALRRGEITHCGCEKPKKRITNYFKIKNMSIDEMAEHYLNIRNTCITCVAYIETCNGESENDCIDNIKQWLLQEVEDE